MTRNHKSRLLDPAGGTHRESVSLSGSFFEGISIMYYTVATTNYFGRKSVVFKSLDNAIKWAKQQPAKFDGVLLKTRLFKHVLNIASNNFDKFDMSDLL